MNILNHTTVDNPILRSASLAIFLTAEYADAELVEASEQAFHVQKMIGNTKEIPIFMNRH